MGLSHNLLQLSDSPIRTQRSGRVPKKSSKVSKVSECITGLDNSKLPEKESALSDSTYENNSDVEGEPIDNVGNKKHPSKNYSKIDLYDKWVHARNQATDRKKEVDNLQKEVKLQKKTIVALEKEVGKGENFELKVYQLQDQLKDVNANFQTEKDKAQTLKKNSRSSTECTNKMLASMKATYESICSKKDFEFKSQLCELQLKFKETELKYNHTEKENKRLNEEIVRLKKNTTQVNELKVASLKSEIQIRSMVDKSNLK